MNDENFPFTDVHDMMFLKGLLTCVKKDQKESIPFPHLAISQSRNLAISLSRYLAILLQQSCDPGEPHGQEREEGCQEQSDDQSDEKGKHRHRDFGD